MIENFDKLQKILGLTFHSPELITSAFIHKSFLNENEGLSINNERLEFLGDAVLELIVTDYLYKNYPTQPEGQLTNWRSALVKGKNLAKVSSGLGLGEFLLLSRGEELSGGREKEYILANLTEALIGAIYLDQGYAQAEAFVMQYIISRLDEILASGQNIDAKSKVQEIAQDKLNVTPRYKVEAEIGPDHDKTFDVGIYFGDDRIAGGQGNSKQSAEQSAAREALKVKGWA